MSAIEIKRNISIDNISSRVNRVFTFPAMGVGILIVFYPKWRLWAATYRLNGEHIKSSVGTSRSEAVGNLRYFLMSAKDENVAKVIARFGDDKALKLREYAREDVESMAIYLIQLGVRPTK